MPIQSQSAAIQTLQDALAKHSAGRIPEALQIYTSVASQLQHLGQFWHFYGLALFQAGDTAKATDCFRRALLLIPNDANCINRFACIFLAEHHPESAHRQLRHALAITPDHPEAWRNIAETERLDGNPAAALQSLEKAMTLCPNEAYKASQAVLSYRKSLLLAPSSPQALNNLQLAERRIGRMQDAVRNASRACLIEPENIGLQHGLTDALLSAGEIERGHARNFWRHLKPEILIIRHGLPKEWDGAPCRDGAGLLVCHEQGIGDELRFVSCIPDIQKRFNGPVFLESDKRLLPLFARSFPDVTVIEKIQRSETVPSTAQYAPLIGAHGIGQYMMLADMQSFVRPSLQSFPSHAGYLKPDVSEVRRWKNSFRAHGERPAVGFSWRSGMRRAGARHNYPELADIAPFFKAADFLPVCLQYDVSASEIAAIQTLTDQQLDIPPGIDQKDELDRVAAMIAALDLVISPNTSVLMMAGAVGTPSIGLHSQCGAIFFGAGADPWFPIECSLVKTGDRAWPALIDEAVPHLVRILSEYR